MAEDFEHEPRKWSLEEIDELLRDSGMKGDGEEPVAEEPVLQKKAESVDPRPTYDENVEHKIRTKAVEHSEVSQATRVFGTLESDKYRERFLNRPVQNLEKTAEHQFLDSNEAFERGGFIKRESNFKNTVELQPVPTIVSDEVLQEEAKSSEGDGGVDKTKTIGLRSLAVTDGNAVDTEIEEEDFQLSFEGFNTEEVPEKISEAEVEKELIEKRREKAAGFVLSKEAMEENETDIKFGIDEYRTVNDRFKVGYYLKRKKNNAFVGSVVSGICVLLLLIVSVVVRAFDSSVMPFVVINLILTVVSLVACRDNLIDGIKNAVKLNFNRHSGVMLPAVVSLLYGVALLVGSSASENDVLLYSAAALLPLTLNTLASYFEYSRIQKNFEIITEKDLYAIGKINKKETAFEIGRGLLLDEPNVIASQKTKFPARFLELSEKYYPSDDINKRTVPITFGVSVAVAAVTCVITRDFFASFGALVAALSVSMPYFAFLWDAVAIGNVSKKLKTSGSVVSGWEACRECSGANAIAVEATEIFDREGGNIFGIKTFHSMKADEAILDTAALLVASGGPLGELFKRVILGKTELLPPVETLAYEDKLGLSAWIQNRRVLVGSADLLRNHNVEVPEKAFIDRFLHDDRYPLFLAIEGKLAAMFIVSYDADERNTKLFRKIERNSISLLVRSDDANITDEMIATKLSLPQSGVKVLSAVSSDILKTYKNEVQSAADASLLHDGQSRTFLECLAAVLSLNEKKHMAMLLQIGASGIGMAFVAALGFVSGMSALSCVQLMITQGFFTAVGLAGSKLLKR